MVMILPLLAGCGIVDRVSGRKKYDVPSEVMEPTIKKGSRVTVDMARGEYVPKLGDVIVFEAPESWSAGARVARVIGVPGVAVKCCDNGERITLNERPLEEPYIKEPPASHQDFGPVVVPQGRVWVQGDNRHVSLDSRSHLGEGVEGATVPVSNVVGVVDLPTPD
ncbi:signal peptidase I [Streptosporangium lutulentum]|uniref:Signal peptidase I n=1 Tax=Streptosporangium lutulentum TaxID=1461250 RepID=A0ABT9QCW1_9ACTN|nr:signal peptidase I [Streptosporangium lutulentum]MDP9844602.1 signal peptidase I [Streptosporangium lutulentum]